MHDWATGHMMHSPLFKEMKLDRVTATVSILVIQSRSKLLTFLSDIRKHIAVGVLSVPGLQF
jgi:hypothetical protein